MWFTDVRVGLGLRVQGFWVQGPVGRLQSQFGLSGFKTGDSMTRGFWAKQSGMVG